MLNTQGAYNQNVRDVSLYGGDDLRPGDVVMGVHHRRHRGRRRAASTATPARARSASSTARCWQSGGWAGHVQVTVQRTYVEVLTPGRRRAP